MAISLPGNRRHHLEAILSPSNPPLHPEPHRDKGIHPLLVVLCLPRDFRRRRRRRWEHTRNSRVCRQHIHHRSSQPPPAACTYSSHRQHTRSRLREHIQQPFRPSLYLVAFPLARHPCTRSPSPCQASTRLATPRLEGPSVHRRMPIWRSRAGYRPRRTRSTRSTRSSRERHQTRRRSLSEEEAGKAWRVPLPHGAGASPKRQPFSDWNKETF